MFSIDKVVFSLKAKGICVNKALSRAELVRRLKESIKNEDIHKIIKENDYEPSNT